MLNRLCVYYLNRASTRQQTNEQTKYQLNKNRAFFDKTRLILNEIKAEIQGYDQLTFNSASDQADLANRVRNTHTLNEGRLLALLGPKCDELLRPNRALQENFHLPSNLEGNLVLIAYLLDSSLVTVYEKLAWEAPVVQIPRIYDAQGQCYGDLSRDLSQGKIKEIEQEFEEPESPIEFSETFMAEEIHESGFADKAPVQVQRTNSRSRSRGGGRRADMSSFDREKFYKRLGINVKDENVAENPRADDQPQQTIELSQVNDSELQIDDKVPDGRIPSLSDSLINVQGIGIQSVVKTEVVKIETPKQLVDACVQSVPEPEQILPPPKQMVSQEAQTSAAKKILMRDAETMPRADSAVKQKQKQKQTTDANVQTKQTRTATIEAQTTPLEPEPKIETKDALTETQPIILPVQKMTLSTLTQTEDYKVKNEPEKHDYVSHKDVKDIRTVTQKPQKAQEVKKIEMITIDDQEESADKMDEQQQRVVGRVSQRGTWRAEKKQYRDQSVQSSRAPSPPKQVVQSVVKKVDFGTQMEVQTQDVDEAKNKIQAEADLDEFEELIEAVEVQSAEFGSASLADAEEVSIEKSLDIVVARSRRRRADLCSFDREAFYRRQGVYNSPIEEKVAIMERQMTTEVYDFEMADQCPVELSKQVDLAKKQRPPDMVDRDAFYKRLGLDLSEKKSEAPTEKKADQYSLPTLEPMMLTWTYQAMRFEEQKSVESEDEIVEAATPDEAQTPPFEEAAIHSTSEAENLTLEDQEEGIQLRNIQKSSLENKLKFNDYVFDENQNLQDQLLKIELRQMVGADSENMASMKKIMKQKQLHEWPAQSHIKEKARKVSPRVRYAIDLSQDKPRSRALYLDEDEANQLSHAVKFVSPVSRGDERNSVTELGFVQKYHSPNQLPPPANEDAQPYMPYRSSKLKKPSRQMVQISQSKVRESRNQQIVVPSVSGTKTPQANSHENGFRFPFSGGGAGQEYTVEESAPTTKIDHNLGNLSERLTYNQDPLSYNRNMITIDDDGNINVGSSPSHSPIRDRDGIQAEERLDDAKTFQSSHFLFSHLMSFDAKKHTLSQLNKSNRALLVQKGLQSQARDYGVSSRHGSPSCYSRSGRGSVQVGARGGQLGGLGNLSRILAGGNNHRRNGSLRRSFLSGAEASMQYSVQHPNVIVKQASKVNQQHLAAPSGSSAGTNSFINDLVPQVEGRRSEHRSSSRQQLQQQQQQRRGERDHSSGIKQHTFYPGQFHQIIIPEQVHEETHRKMTTAKFKREDGIGNQEESKQLNSVNVHKFLFNEPTDRSNSALMFAPLKGAQETEEIADELESPEASLSGGNSAGAWGGAAATVLNQKSSMSQGGFSNYLVGGGGSSQLDQSKKGGGQSVATGTNIFSKYLDRNNISSGTRSYDQTGSGRQQVDPTLAQLPLGQVVNTTETAGNAPTFRSSNVQYVSRDKVQMPVTPQLRQTKTLEGSLQTAVDPQNTTSQNHNTSQEHVTFQNTSNHNNAGPAPIMISQLLADQRRAISSGLNRAGGVLSRQTVDYGRSEFGGRSSAQGDTTSVLMKKRVLEMKGPQASDIMPVFRLTKAQPIREYSGSVQRQNRDAAHDSRNSPHAMAQHKMFMHSDAHAMAHQRALQEFNHGRTMSPSASSNYEPHVNFRIQDLK